MKSTLDAVPKRKCISVFKVGKLWLFKVFFDNRELFEALLDHYNKDLYRFEFKSTGARNNALKLPKFAKYAQILKNSVASKDTARERLFLMKDLSAVEEAVGLGAKIVEGYVVF